MRPQHGDVDDPRICPRNAVDVGKHRVVRTVRTALSHSESAHVEHHGEEHRKDHYRHNYRGGDPRRALLFRPPSYIFLSVGRKKHDRRAVRQHSHTTSAPHSPPAAQLTSDAIIQSAAAKFNARSRIAAAACSERLHASHLLRTARSHSAALPPSAPAQSADAGSSAGLLRRRGRRRADAALRLRCPSCTSRSASAARYATAVCRAAAPEPAYGIRHARRVTKCRSILKNRENYYTITRF